MPSRRMCGALAITVITLGGSPARAAETVCFPAIGTVLGEPPTIDGVIGDPNLPGEARDPGWNRASLIYLQSNDAAGNAKLVTLQVGVVGSDVYLGGVITLPPGQASANLIDNTLIFGFSPDAASASGLKIELNPLLKGDTADFPPPNKGLDFTAIAGTHGSRLYWMNPLTPWGTTGQTDIPSTSWLADPTRFAYARHGNRWSFEMRIKKNSTNDLGASGGVDFGTTGSFIFYYDVITSTYSVSNPAPGGLAAYEEYSFPPNLRINDDGTGTLGSGPIENFMPPRAKWAVGSLPGSGATCTGGVSLSAANFNIAHSSDGSGPRNFEIKHPNVPNCASPPNPLPAAADNWFTAVPSVNVSDPSTQTKLGVRFRVAGFGLPGGIDWAELPGSPAAEQTIVGNGTLTFQKQWSLSANEWCTKWVPTLTVMDHQCIEAEMYSSNGSARLLNRSVQNNTVWGVASQFRSKAAVSSRGYGAPPAGQSAHKFLLFVESGMLSADEEKRLAESNFRPPACSAADPDRNTVKCCEQQKQQTSAMNEWRIRHSTTLLPDGKVLAAGGRGREWKGLSTTELYDPMANTWTPAPSLNRPRFDQAAIQSKASELFLIGGGNDDKNSEMAQSTEFYVIEKRAWVGGPALKMPYFAPSAIAMPNGVILAASDNWNDTSLYNPTAREWGSGPRLSKLHGGGRLILLQDGRVLYVGGSDIAELFDQREKRWTHTGPVNEARSGHTATLLKNGKVLVAGGHVFPPQRDGGTTKAAELFDPATNSWTRIPDMGAARDVHTATLLSDGRVLVAGGYDDNQSGASVSSTTEIYDPATNAWTPGAPLAVGRGYHTATLLGDGSVLLAGGADSPSSERYSPTGTKGGCAGATSDTSPNAGSNYRTARTTTRGYRMTGDSIVINGRRYEHAQFVGSYGYLVRHFVTSPAPADTALAAVTWTHDVAPTDGATALVQLPLPGGADTNTFGAGAPIVQAYALDLLPNTVTELTTSIGATDGDRCPLLFGRINCCRCSLGTGIDEGGPDRWLGGLAALALVLARRRRRNANN